MCWIYGGKDKRDCGDEIEDAVTFRIVVLDVWRMTREIVVMRSRYTLCIKDAVMANFRRVVLDLWRKRHFREIVVMRSRYTLCIKDAVMANFRIVVLDLWRKRQE